MKKYLLLLKERSQHFKVNKSLLISVTFHLLLFTGFTYSPVQTRLSMPASEVNMVDAESRDDSDEVMITIRKDSSDKKETDILERSSIPIGGGSTIYLPVFEVHKPPKIKLWIEPVYPITARQAGIEGTVIVEIDISEKGRVEAARVIKSPGFGFEQAALAAIKKSRFYPAIKDGNPIAVRVRLPVKFEIE